MFTHPNNPLLFFFASSLIALACGDTTEFDTLVSDHRASIQGTVQDCGSVSRDHTCRAAVSTAEQCLADAFTSCTPAELRVELPTTEGDTLVFVYFTQPAAVGEGCEVIEFQDVSRDAFKGDYGDFSQRRCTTTSVTSGDGNNTCAQLQRDACSLVQEWYR